MHYSAGSKLWAYDNWHVPIFSFNPKGTSSKECLHILRDNYDPNIEERDHLSLDLIVLLLNSVEKKNKEVFSIAFNVVERLLKICAHTIKPYLSQYIQSLGVSLDDYSAVVSSLYTKNESFVLPIIFTPIIDTLHSYIVENLPITLPWKSIIP